MKEERKDFWGSAAAVGRSVASAARTGWESTAELRAQAANGIGAMYDSAADALREAQEIERIRHLTEEKIARAEESYQLSRAMLADEIQSFDAELRLLDEQARQAVAIMQADGSGLNLGLDIRREIKLSPGATLDARDIAEAMLTSVVSGMGAVSLATLFGVASTGAAVSSLGGAAYVSSVLAVLGGGALAVGGLGIAGGAALLGTVVATPFLGLAALGLKRQLADSYTEVLRYEQEALRYVDELYIATQQQDMARRTLRQLALEIRTEFYRLWQEQTGRLLGAGRG